MVPPRCPQELIVMEPSPQSPSTLQLHCGPAPISRDSHQMLRVRRSVMLQKPVPLTPSLGRVYVRAGVFFFFLNVQFYSCCNFPRQRGQRNTGMEGEFFFFPLQIKYRHKTSPVSAHTRRGAGQHLQAALSTFSGT